MQTFEIEQSFGPYRAPTEVTIPKYQKIQSMVLELAIAINEECPKSREASIALTHLQSVKMFANAAIAIHTK